MCPIRGRIEWVERHRFRGFGALDSSARRARYAIGESEAADKPQATLRREPKQIARYQRGQRYCKEWCGASADGSGRMHEPFEHPASLILVVVILVLMMPFCPVVTPAMMVVFTIMCAALIIVVLGIISPITVIRAIAVISGWRAANSNQKRYTMLGEQESRRSRGQPLLYKASPHESNRCDSQEHDAGVLESGRSGNT